jgi:hypothetical protein
MIEREEDHEIDDTIIFSYNEIKRLSYLLLLIKTYFNFSSLSKNDVIFLSIKYFDIISYLNDGVIYNEIYLLICFLHRRNKL